MDIEIQIGQKKEGTGLPVAGEIFGNPMHKTGFFLRGGKAVPGMNVSSLFFVYTKGSLQKGGQDIRR